MQLVKQKITWTYIPRLIFVNVRCTFDCFNQLIRPSTSILEHPHENIHVRVLGNISDLASISNIHFVFSSCCNLKLIHEALSRGLNS